VPSVLLCISLTALLLPASAQAHVSEQGFVLLLPTDIYIASGLIVVVATLLALAFLPSNTTMRLFNARRWPAQNRGQTLSSATSLAAFVLLLAFLYLGWFGPRDPLKNLLPLGIWTLWWIGLVSIQGLFGDVWRWLNPWHGVLGLFSRDRSINPPTQYADPDVSVWPALALLIAFYLLMLADVAPDDPARLAFIVSSYVVCAFIGMRIVGIERWFTQFDFIAIVMRLYSYMAPLARSPKSPQQRGFGVPGWALHEHPTPSISLALFALIMLGCGSFDGLNETFWWLGLIGVNPLDFQGRSSIVYETVIGVLLVNLLLIAVFALCVWLGLRLAKTQGSKHLPSFKTAFSCMALCVLPIALVYHVAHFIAAFLVNTQYSLAALSDPFNQGADWLELGRFYVTTGFLNNHHTVEILWLTQAGLVVVGVVGHVLSILLSHRVAETLFSSRRAALLSHTPLALFMVGYTFLGLWLLASPRGA